MNLLKKCNFKISRLAIGLSLVAATPILAAQHTAMATAYAGEFPRLPFETVMPTGQSVAVECQNGIDTPYSPYDWPDARASLEILQGGGRSIVTVDMTGGRPNTLYTMWVRLRGNDASGADFGGSPLTGIPGNPLIPSSELPNALAAMGAPIEDNMHGFRSDENGDGRVIIELDFPIIGGAYPFDRFAGFDPADPRFPLDNPSNQPVAIVGESAGAPFTLRLASHCTDGLGHGLVPEPHEGWFDWKMQ